MISPVNKSQFRLLKQYTDCQDIWWQNWQSRHFSIYERLVIDIYCISSIKRVPIPFCVFWSFFFYFFFLHSRLVGEDPSRHANLCYFVTVKLFWRFSWSNMSSVVCKRYQNSLQAYASGAGTDQTAVHRIHNCVIQTVKAEISQQCISEAAVDTGLSKGTVMTSVSPQGCTDTPSMTGFLVMELINLLHIPMTKVVLLFFH